MADVLALLRWLNNGLGGKAVLPASLLQNSPEWPGSGIWIATLVSLPGDNLA